MALTARQQILASLLSELGRRPLAYTPAPAINDALTNAGIGWRIADDGLGEIAEHQAAETVARAIEALVGGQAALVRAIYTGERDRHVAHWRDRSSHVANEKTVLDARVTDAEGTSI